MAQANVAREPSMEEILASIRKIIESNDLTEEQDTATDELAGDEELSPVVERAAPPVSLLNRIPGDRTESSGSKSRDVSMDEPRIEPLAPLRPGLDTKGEKPPLSPEVDTEPEPSEQARPEAPASLADIAAEATTEPSGRPATPENEEGDVVFLAETGPDSGDKSEREVGTGEKVGTGDPAPVEAKVEKMDEEPRALISPAVGARVAASFGNLSQAVTNGPTRSFDDIAEDMLRPMLQQWMDDNLPTLVERLVREEIERVARGR